ncbi:MAG TPA: hypothetical protein VES67_00935 [Vicinamibacterales bacterium]|nr:hypothetical protein [Vicinamibacterales bacterium]
MTASMAPRSGVAAFFAALAIPMTVSVTLVASSLAFGLRGPLVALLVNAFLVSEVAGVSQVFALPMPVGYFRPRRFERAWAYEWLGIRAFKRLMRSRLYRRINPHFQLVGGRRGLAELSQTMRSAEAAHVLVFVGVSVIAACALWLRWVDVAAWLTFFNVLFNGYPVMLQRYNRLLHSFLQ